MRLRARLDSAAREHARARVLAAWRMDEVLDAADAAWLSAHLDHCEACRVVAAAYDVQRADLRALRVAQPEPPRDLWARTAAAMDAGGRRSGHRSRWTGAIPLAPVVGLVAIVVVVGAGLLNGSVLLPPVGSTATGGAQATPIALAAGELRVISRAQDGSVEIMTRQLNEVCPLGADTCGLPTTLAITQSAQLGGTANLDAIISPSQDRLVVVERGAGPQSVYVLPVATPVAASPSARPSSASLTPTATPVGPGGPPGDTSPTPGEPTTTPTATTPEPSPTPPGSPSPVDTASPSVEASPSPSVTPTPSAPLAASPPASPSVSPVETPAPTEEPRHTERPGASPSASADTSPEPLTPAPSVAVSPRPDGAIEIARDVTIVGSVAGYSADGSRFAFSARPADGSSGPDVYVWQNGQTTATAVTTDHESVFSGWLGDRILVSRVVDGLATTVELDLGSGDQQAVGGEMMWRPTVSRDTRVAAWWDGTLKLADDGLTWMPDTGSLILAPWPAGGSDAQVLATGPITDWEVRWDDSESVLGVWVTDQGSGSVGRLSLYTIDPGTGLANLNDPTLADAPAYAGFSLQAGRLAWAAPEAGGDTSVQVLAWQGKTIGRLRLPAINGANVVR